MKSKTLLGIIALLCAIAIKAQPPNNTIFFGSAGDGFNKLANISLTNTIFLGGNGDGFSRTANISTSNNIFLGGVGDGWNRTANISASNSIFIGGIGDGWNRTANTSVSNTIFIGGIGDGWNNAGNAAASNNIFLGGVGDGWASAYRPTGPLPVNFLYFNVRKQGKNVALLNWKTAQEINASHYDVERSTDAVKYNFIGKVTATGNTSTESNYSFTDNAPAKGFNYYRLKQVDRDGRFIYTASRVLNFDDMDAGQVKYYPNPTSGLLNIEITDAMKPELKWITVSNTAGIVLDHVKIQPGNSLLIQLNFSKYPKGIYFIQLKTTCCNSTQRIVLQ